MEYVLVAAASLIAGILVYLVAARVGRRLAPEESLEVPVADGPSQAPPTPPVAPPAPGEPAPVVVPAEDPPPASRADAPEGPIGQAFAYRRADLPPVHLPLRTRVLGLLGLIVLIVVAAVAMALALYQAGHLVRLQFERYLG
ncbi:MAG TPA: hypothetical protein VNO17_07505 [Actinomycetota bacterium]|nr:hypothetical protein [Actinomycetota bacterium]